MVIFQLTEADYISVEQQLTVIVQISKNNVRLANPVTLLLTPYNVSEAERTLERTDLVDAFSNYASSKKRFLTSTRSLLIIYF